MWNVVVNRDMRILGVYSPLKGSEAKSHADCVPAPIVAQVVHLYQSTKPSVGDYVGTAASWRCPCCGGKGRCIA